MVVKRITRQDLANTAAERWGESGSDKLFNGMPVHHVLMALGPNPHPDTVDNVSGDELLTRTECTLCGQRAAVVVQLPGVSCECCYDAEGACLCVECIVQVVAVALGTS